jgi:transcription elongation factor Elf1
MPQSRVMVRGFYRCPKCRSIFEFKGDTRRGDGFCSVCEERNSDPVPLRFISRDLPKDRRDDEDEEKGEEEEDDEEQNEEEEDEEEDE